MNIYLTLDYELFMGGQSGTVQNCLIKPMERLVERTKEYGVCYTLFVDAAYLLKLEELKEKNSSLQKDFNDIKKNLRFLVSQGHSIQLHIHPQWYYSTYSGGQWQIDQSHYKMSDIPSGQLTSLFMKSKSLLEDITSVKVTAFRAGGYSLQTLENYSDILIKNSIMADSSVASGQKYISDYQWYDYSKVVGGRIYNFSADVIEEDKEGKLKEFPIANICISTISYILYRLYLKCFKNVGKAYGDGKAVPPNQTLKLLDTRVMNYSFDYIMAPMLYFAYNKMRKAGQEDVVLIGHPKNLSPESIEELRKFIQKINNSVSFRLIQ